MEIKDQGVVREISIRGLEIKKYQKVKHNEVEIMRQKKKKKRELFQEVYHLNRLELLEKLRWQPIQTGKVEALGRDFFNKRK